MKNIITYLVIIVLHAWNISLAHGNQILLDLDHPKGGWIGFGSGLDDVGFDMKSKEVLIHCNWPHCSWGLGVMFQLGAPINSRQIQSIRVKVRSNKGSKTMIYAGLSTLNDATLELSRKKALMVTDKWQYFEFPVNYMAPVKAEATSPDFQKAHQTQIHVVKLLFTQPYKGRIEIDQLLIRRPEIVYAE